MKKILRSAKCLSGEMVSAPISSKFEIFHNSIFSQCERVFQKLKFKTHYWVEIKFNIKHDLVRGDDFLHPAFVPNLGSLSLQKIINGVCGVQGQASLSPQVCIYSRRSDGTTMGGIFKMSMYCTLLSVHDNKMSSNSPVKGKIHSKGF